MIDLKSLAVGDEITMTTVYKVTDLPDRDGDVCCDVIGGFSGTRYLYAHHAADYLPTVIKRVPRPLQVGQKVTTPTGRSGIIVAIVRGMAFVDREHGLSPAAIAVSRLSAA